MLQGYFVNRVIAGIDKTFTRKRPKVVFGCCLWPRLAKHKGTICRHFRKYHLIFNKKPDGSLEILCEPAVREKLRYFVAGLSVR